MRLPDSSLVSLRKALLEWGQKNCRSFPWRLTKDPYRILVAEVMLHRTQARQVIPIYEKFIRRYPNIHALHQSSPQELYTLLRPLGLRWRNRLIRRMTKDLVRKFAGQVPRDKDALKRLPGVSDYIAGAVRCFAWDEPEILLDTNTVRVASRLFGVPSRDSSRRSKTFRDLLGKLLDRDHPRAFNLALLDLAQVICTAGRSPATSVCPLNPWCTFAHNLPLARKPVDKLHRRGAEKASKPQFLRE